MFCNEVPVIVKEIDKAEGDKMSQEVDFKDKVMHVDMSSLICWW